MKNKFYITAAIPYVNARPHIGHALEFVQTDTIARFYRLLGYDVLCLSGGDENALKNVQAAEKENVPIQEFIDKNTELFNKLTIQLNTKFDVWQRGSDQSTHFPSSQELWKLCERNGDIYKKSYKGLYCVGCEAFYTLDELTEQGECLEHLGRKLDEVEEENYFFRLSKYQQKLIELIESEDLQIVPETRKNEILAFLRNPLHDISISRSNERAKNWGVPVPNDPTQKIYVWFDALNIYQSGVGFGWNESEYKKWWPADLHVIGKGIIRFHAVYWPAFLLSAGLPLPKKILAHGYYTVLGQKMSKTLGNVYDPLPIIEKIGADALRYYCLAKTSTFTDGDFSEEKLLDAYNSDLANGLGNLVSRVSKLCERLEDDLEENSSLSFSRIVEDNIRDFRFNEALQDVWQRISNTDKFIESKHPWTLSGEELQKTLAYCVSAIRQIAFDLQPFLPHCASLIKDHYSGTRIKQLDPIFPRKI
jgi:methionyl-tRNA synthetase